MRTLMLSALILASCTLPQTRPEALNTEYKPSGEVIVYGRTASFDAVRVRSTECNLVRRTDDSWGGTLNKEPFDVTDYGESLRGANFTLNREASAGGRTIITGQFQGRIYRFEFDDQKALIRAPGQSMNYGGRQPGPNMTVYGPGGELQLKGEAGAESPPWPQFGLALICMMH